MVVAFLVNSFGDRRPAFIIGILCWLICGTCLCLMTCTVNADEAHVIQNRMKRRLAQKI